MYRAVACKADSITCLVTHAARSRDPVSVHVAFLLSGSLAHLFCDDCPESRFLAEVVYDGGESSVPLLLIVQAVTASSQTILCNVSFI